MNGCHVCEAPHTWASNVPFARTQEQLDSLVIARLCDRDLTTWLQWSLKYPQGSRPDDPLFAPHMTRTRGRMDHDAWARDFARFVQATRQEERGVPA